MSTAATDDYAQLCERVRVLSGIDLAQYKRHQMERRIRAFAGRRGVDDLGDYVSLLRKDPDELAAFLDRMTINVSQLWRNPEQWALLARDVIPALASEGRIRAWSAGCSYGAEAYTLAAICSEVAPDARIEIEGTDIDERMVARAREGRFTADDARSAAPELLRTWFERDGDEGWQAKPELRAITRFEQGDLLRAATRSGRYDLVLCRNTVIYFNEEARDALHARLAESLRSGGYLMVGSTERVTQPREHSLRQAFPFTYQKS